MKLLLLEPPYSNLFNDFAKELSPESTYVHIFNVGYCIYFFGTKKILVTKKTKALEPSSESLEIVSKIRSLANSNIKSPSLSELREMATYRDYLKKFIKLKKITHILAHNDLRWQHAIAKEVSNELGVRIIFTEEGLFRPNTMTFDPLGVNANSSVPRSEDFYLSNKFEKDSSFEAIPNILSKRLKRIVKFTIFLMVNKFGDILGLNSKAQNKSYSFYSYLKLFKTKIISKRKNHSISFPSGKFIFVPLQVSTDTQTILHSIFPGTQSVIDTIESAYKLLPNEIQNEFRLVFKKHPMEAHINYKFSKDSLLTESPTRELIKLSSMVLLVNSTTIVESLLEKKPVLALGESHYNIEGLVKKAKIETLPADIVSILKRPTDINDNLITSFLNYLKYHYQINGNIFYYSKKTLTEMKSRFLNL